MYAQYALLIPGAFFVVFFIAVLAGGALLGLARLGMQALRAASRTRNVKAEVTSSMPLVQPSDLLEAVAAESLTGVRFAYARA